ncbi:hypothetical protein D3C80_676910 [compost metagenome]
MDQSHHLALLVAGTYWISLCSTVPLQPHARERPPDGVPSRLLPFPGQQGVDLLDAMIVAKDRLGRHGVAPGPEVPLEIADPHDHLGDPGGVGVLLKPPELLGADRVAVQSQGRLRLPQIRQRRQDLAFEVLHHVHGDIQEVAGSARRIQHLRLAQLGVECANDPARIRYVAPQIGAQGVCLVRLPVGAQRLHDGGLHQPPDIGLGRIVGAQLSAFDGIQGLFEESAEDGGLDRGPVQLGRRDQRLKLRFCYRQGGRMLEQAAVEPPDVLADGRTMPALIHPAEEVVRAQVETAGRPTIAFEKPQEAPLLDEVHAVGEHGENALHDEQRRLIGARRLHHGRDTAIWILRNPSADRAHQPCETLGDIRRHLRDVGLGVQAHGVAPDSPQPLPHLAVPQVGHGDAMTASVWKGSVALALAIEVRPQIDGSAHVDHHDEGRPFIQRLGVVLGLALGVQHDPLQRTAAWLGPFASPPGQSRQVRQGIQIAAGAALARLLGLQHEGPAPITIDGARFAAAVFQPEANGTFEAVIQVADRLLVRPGHPDHPTKLADKRLIVRSLADGRRVPARDERLNIHRLPSQAPRATLDRIYTSIQPYIDSSPCLSSRGPSAPPAPRCGPARPSPRRRDGRRTRTGKGPASASDDRHGPTQAGR